jgi:N-acetylglucosaminyldiphosphoundecaprenol N-acetyl-beta-D-mannosaminyltransferase
MKIIFAKQEFLVGQLQEVVTFLLKQLQGKKTSSKVILPCSLHDLAVISAEQNLASSYKAVDYLVNDSMWLTFWFRFKYRHPLDRLYGPTLMQSFLNRSASQKNLKHYFLAADRVSQLSLQAHILKNYPRIKAEFAFLPRDTSLVVEKKFLQKALFSRALVIWLGIGSPKQVQLAEFLKQKSQGKLIICVGAAFDFLSGQKQQAPFWMQNSGFEWLFRLFSEPRRLWKRYLVVVPKFFIFSLKEKLKL